MDQQGVVYVLLNYCRAISTGSTTDNLFYFLERLANVYSIASVSVFARLNNPRILWYAHLALKVLNLFSQVCVILGIVILVRVLIFTIPRTKLFNSLLLLVLQVLNFLLELVVIICKLYKFWIFQSFFCVKCEWENLKWVLTDRVVVGTHVDKHTLFVCQLFVLLKFVIELH